MLLKVDFFFWSLLFSSSLIAGVARAESPSASSSGTDYVIKKGDTCASIALKYYGDRGLVDVIHVANPGMGPPPHSLKEGKILRLPPKPSKTESPDARLKKYRNKVEVQAPDARPAKQEDPLYRGNKVSTKENSAADVLFRDESELKLGEETLIVILGDTKAKSSANRDTTLISGTVRAKLGAPAANLPVIRTESGVVQIGGEAQIDVDKNKTSRISNYVGKALLSSGKDKVAIPENFGSKVEKGKAPTPPKPLPAAPIWKTTLPSLILSDKPVDVSAIFEPGKGGAPVQTWHIQLAADPVFIDLPVNVKVPVSITKLEAKNVGSGTYRARVSGIDADFFEGPGTAMAPMRVLVPSVKKMDSLTQSVDTEDLFCGVDGSKLEKHSAPIVLSSTVPHKLSCSTTDDGKGAQQIEIPAQSLSGLKGDVKLIRDQMDRVVVEVKLLSKEGKSLPPMPVHFRTQDLSQSVKSVEQGSDGSYLVTVEPKRSRLDQLENRGDVEASLRTYRPTQTIQLIGILEGEKTARQEVDFALNPVSIDSLGSTNIPPSDHGAWELELGAGASLTSSKFRELGLQLIAGFGRRFVVGPGAIALGGRFGFELHPNRSLRPENYPEDVDVKYRSFDFGIPISYRLGRLIGHELFQPYVGIEPGLLYQMGTYTPKSTGISKDGTALNFALKGTIGAQLMIGPGFIFLEYGYRRSWNLSYSRGGVEMNGSNLLLGYRFTF